MRSAKHEIHVKRNVGKKRWVNRSEPSFNLMDIFQPIGHCYFHENQGLLLWFSLRKTFFTEDDSEKSLFLINQTYCKQK